MSEVSILCGFNLKARWTWRRLCVNVRVGVSAHPAEDWWSFQDVSLPSIDAFWDRSLPYIESSSLFCSFFFGVFYSWTFSILSVGGFCNYLSSLHLDSFVLSFYEAFFHGITPNKVFRWWRSDWNLEMFSWGITFELNPNVTEVKKNNN